MPNKRIWINIAFLICIISSIAVNNVNQTPSMTPHQQAAPCHTTPSVSDFSPNNKSNMEISTFNISLKLLLGLCGNGLIDTFRVISPNNHLICEIDNIKYVDINLQYDIITENSSLLTSIFFNGAFYVSFSYSMGWDSIRTDQNTTLDFTVSIKYHDGVIEYNQYEHYLVRYYFFGETTNIDYSIILLIIGISAIGTILIVLLIRSNNINRLCNPNTKDGRYNIDHNVKCIKMRNKLKEG